MTMRACNHRRSPHHLGPVLGCALAMLLNGCGSSSSATAPGPVPAPSAAGISGTWVQEGADRREWTLTQFGIQVDGPASFSHQNDASLGTVAGRGRVLGSVAGGIFRFSETYEGVTIASRPEPSFCSTDTDGQLTIDGNTMSGTLTESIGCGGDRVSRTTRALVVRRK